MSSELTFADVNRIPTDLDIQLMEDKLEETISRKLQLVQEIENEVLEARIRDPRQSRLLPVDLLTSIFSLFIFPEPEIIGRLLFVCRDWYSVLTSTPVLWSAIRIVTTLEARQAPLLAKYCQTCIERSGSSLLDTSRWRSFVFRREKRNHDRLRNLNRLVLRHALPGQGGVESWQRHAFDYAALVVSHLLFLLLLHPKPGYC
ncbi:hypothetical protein FRC19_002451 [Serendipita sp. 401]|nr:hypothetical protein FRC19_002451 [Serendipita sp. 401]KAG8852310.1 hypothetical protein FRC20_001550 [Serendipita sp. 405]